MLRAHKQTDQTTTLCVQEVEIYLERWEVLGALVVRARAITWVQALILTYPYNTVYFLPDG